MNEMGRMLGSQPTRPPLSSRPVTAAVPPQPVSAGGAPPTASPAAAPAKPAVVAANQADLHNSFRRVAFYAGLAYLFLRLSNISEFLTYYLHINFYLLYLFAPPALLGALFTGGLRRTFKLSPAWYLTAFFIWMMLATPFSFWKGDSIRVIIDYGRFHFSTLLVTAGLAVSWREIRMWTYTFAAAALSSVITARFFTTLDGEGRLTMEASGNIGNSNDLGAHMLLVMPFLLFPVLDRSKNLFVRFLPLPFLAYGLIVVLGTGSRGCMIAMGVMFLFALFAASVKQKTLILAAGLTVAVLVPLTLPSTMLVRLGSLFHDVNDIRDQTTQEAYESRSAREYLLKQSLLYTMQHPIFGVGPGQFPNYEGNERKEKGERGQWKVTHNFLTQISSECGIPAVIFMVLAVGTALVQVLRTYRLARKRKFQDIANVCHCFLLGLIGYICSVIFLAHAYHYYLPSLIGLAIAITTVARQEMAGKDPAPRAVPSLAPTAGGIWPR